MIAPHTSRPHIWLLKTDYLDSDPANTRKMLTLLSSDEKSKYYAFKFTKDKALYLTAHYLKRRVLSLQYPEITPDRWRFTVNQYGKPFIQNKMARNMQFNLSHAQKLAAIFISNTDACGIDVEWTHRKINWRSLAQQCFHPKEYQRIRDTSDSALFFQYWTLKEAYIKLLGKGLSFPLNEFFIDIRKNSIEVECASQHSGTANHKIQLWHKELQDGYHIAGAIHKNTATWPPLTHWFSDILHKENETR